MSSRFHSQNERIRKALAKRLKRKALEIYDEELRRGHSNDYAGELEAHEPGDGRIVRKTIDDEEYESWG